MTGGEAQTAPEGVPRGTPWSRLRERLVLRRGGDDVLDTTVYRFILRYSLPEQLYLVIGTLISFPFLYYSLDLPKTIINSAIGGKSFPRHIFGFEINQVPYLFLMSGVFLLFVLINGWFKYHLNVRKGRVGERMLRRLRYSLYERVLRFPISHFDRTASGEIVAMVTAELEPVGGFIGDAFALPISQGGTLLTILIFMFVQNPILGLAAIALYPVQGYVIPKKQRVIRALGRQRVRTLRQLSDRIGETIATQVEIRTNDGWAWQLADISRRLGHIYDLRFEIYNRKFSVKFLNNFLGQLTPFFFYSIGGYFVITGNLSFGALVAVLAAYKDLSSPWKELLDFYQNQQDVAIKYEQVVEQFHVADMIEPRLLTDPPQPPAPPQGEVAAINVSVTDGDGIRRLDAVSFAFPLGSAVAIVGQSNSGRNVLPRLFARLYQPTSGRITIGGADINAEPLTITGRRVGYVGPSTALFSASVRDNLLLGLRHHPAADGDTPNDTRLRALREAQESGNSPLDLDVDWTDYEQAGVADKAGLDHRIVEVLQLVDVDQDIYFFGLRSQLDPERHPEAASGILEARRRLEQVLRERDLAALVERFEPHRYNSNSSVAANLLFGTPIGPAFADEGLAGNHYVQEVLDRGGLTDDLVRAGAQVAETMVELFGDLPPEHDFFEAFSFISAEDLPALERILAHLTKVGPEGLLPPERERLLSLALKLVVARDRLGLVDEGLQQRVLEARKALAEGLPDEFKGAVEFFDPDIYNGAARLEENILFGTIHRGEAGSRERVQAAITEVLGELGLREVVLAVGLDYAVGTSGSRLSPVQRQKLAIARAVLKRPDLLVLDDATAVLDGASEAHIVDGLRRELAGRTLIASLSRPNLGRAFDQVLVMEQGRLARLGPYEELSRPDSPLAPLLAAE